VRPTRKRAPPLALLLALGAAGCETFAPNTCDPSAGGNPSVTYAGGQTKDGVYMSSPWDGQLLNFPGGMHYSLVHGLGIPPGWIQSYLSFDESGGPLAQAAGNQVEVVKVDGELIEVGNDSCVGYWLLVTAGVGSAPAGP